MASRIPIALLLVALLGPTASAFRETGACTPNPFLPPTIGRECVDAAEGGVAIDGNWYVHAHRLVVGATGEGVALAVEVANVPLVVGQYSTLALHVSPAALAVCARVVAAALDLTLQCSVLPLPGPPSEPPGVPPPPSLPPALPTVPCIKAIPGAEICLL